MTVTPSTFGAFPLRRFKNETWFFDLFNYIELRYASISDRLAQTFRYVDLHPANKDVFSYEYASLLRDIGSVISSVLDTLLSNVKGGKERRYYNIDDFRSFLLQEIEDIENVRVVLNVQHTSSSLFPFEGFKGDSHSLQWWKAFTDIKHSDIECIDEGCQSNVIYAYAALTVLYASLSKPIIYWEEISSKIIHSVNSIVSKDKELYFKYQKAEWPRYLNDKKKWW